MDYRYLTDQHRAQVRAQIVLELELAHYRATIIGGPIEQIEERHAELLAEEAT